MKDLEVFPGTNFTDILREIHMITEKKRDRIDVLIKDLQRLIKEPNDAVVVAPLIKDYLDVMVKNDEHLVKIAAIVQRIIAADSKGKSGNSLDDLLSESEKEQLLADALSELEDATKELEEKTIASGSIDGNNV